MEHSLKFTVATQEWGDHVKALMTFYHECLMEQLKKLKELGFAVDNWFVKVSTCLTFLRQIFHSNNFLSCFKIKSLFLMISSSFKVNFCCNPVDT